MSLSDITPFSRSFAFAEIIILLVIAAALGYLLARLTTRSSIISIEEDLSEKQIKLTECQSTLVRPAVVSADIPVKGASKTVYPVEELNSGVRQDLQVIEGIGPKIQDILNKNGIYNYAHLSAIPAVRIARILHAAGPRFQMHDPTSWPEQAALAHEEKWNELNILKEKLIGGR